MFTQHPITLINNPECIKAAPDLQPQDFLYYDKDGFELNRAEQKFYAAMGYPIHYPILNHTCWQEPWFDLEPNSRLILDHSMFLCRASYSGDAVEQLHTIKSVSYLADYLIRTRQKWGFDFALDAVAEDGTVYEVVHIEYDNYDYQEFRSNLDRFEQIILTTDWVSAADSIWNTRDSWTSLQGFEQNHWKANYLLGWQKAEYTEKSV